MAENVRITWPSGVEVYSEVAEDMGTGVGYSRPKLIGVSSIYRAVNKEKAVENSIIEVTLDNTDGYFTGKMIGADRYIKGASLAYYDGSTLLFTGKISRLPRCPLTEFRVVADIAQAGFSAKLNRVIKIAEFPAVPANNEGKYSNIIMGTADDTGGAGKGMCVAHRVGTNLFLAAWHELHSLISVFDQDGVDISASCTLASGKKVIDGGFEDWASATDLTSWSETLAGGSTVNREETTVHAGTYSARLDIDASNSLAVLYQILTVTAGERLRISVWYKAPAGCTALLMFRDSASNVFLQSDGTWTATNTSISLPGTGDWEQFILDFDAHASYTSYRLRLLNGDGCASQSIYFDNMMVNGVATISYTSTDDEIYFNAEGFEVDLAWEENPAKCLEELNSRFGSFAFDGIDAAATIYSDRGYTGISVVIGQAYRPDITWGEFLQAFAQNWDALIYMQANGNLKIKVLDWGAETAVASIPEIYIHDYDHEIDMEKIVNEYRRMWWYHWRLNYFHRLPQDIVETTLWEAAPDSLDLRQHSDDASAADVAAGILFFAKEPTIFYNLKVERSQAKVVDIGDVVNVRYPRGLYPDEYRMMQVYRIERAEEGKIVWRGLDVTEINYGLIRLYNDADPEIHELLIEGVDADCGVLL